MSNELCSWSRRKCQMHLVLCFVTHFFELEYLHPSFFEVVEPSERPNLSILFTVNSTTTS